MAKYKFGSEEDLINLYNSVDKLKENLIDYKILEERGIKLSDLRVKEIPKDPFLYGFDTYTFNIVDKNGNTIIENISYRTKALNLIHALKDGYCVDIKSQMVFKKEDVKKALNTLKEYEKLKYEKSKQKLKEVV